MKFFVSGAVKYDFFVSDESMSVLREAMDRRERSREVVDDLAQRRHECLAVFDRASKDVPIARDAAARLRLEWALESMGRDWVLDTIS